MSVRGLIPIFDPPRVPGLKATPAQTVSRKVALLCGGHSLPDHWNADVATGYDFVIAINGACFMFPCDYAVAVDRNVVLKILATPARHPRVALLTYAAKMYLKEARKAGVPVVPIENIPNKPDGTRHKSYTMPRALQWALRQCGPDGGVDLFGVDMSDVGNDVAGLKSHNNALRWKQEAECLRVVWDARVGRVLGRLHNARLEFLRGERAGWPG